MKNSNCLKNSSGSNYCSTTKNWMIATKKSYSSLSWTISNWNYCYSMKSLISNWKNWSWKS
jgi:hypothetical protein